MLTYHLKKSPGVPLYEALYRCIREDILSGKLASGQKLPSKRALAANLEVSKITVEGAYQQLLSEGYICAREKVGYFVETVEGLHIQAELVELSVPSAAVKSGVDLTAGGSAQFPFSVWSRLQRTVMLDLGEKLLRPLPNGNDCSALYIFRPSALRTAGSIITSPLHDLLSAVTPLLRAPD